MMEIYKNEVLQKIEEYKIEIEDFNNIGMYYDSKIEKDEID